MLTRSEGLRLSLCGGILGSRVPVLGELRGDLAAAKPEGQPEPDRQRRDRSTALGGPDDDLVEEMVSGTFDGGAGNDQVITYIGGTVINVP